MKRLLLAAFLAIAQMGMAQAPANYTYVFGTNVTDASGSKLVSGTITFTATNSAGLPIGFRVGGGGTVILRPVQATITNGSFNVNLADVSASSPSYFCYAVTAVDNATGNQVLGGSDYACIQPYGSTYDLDNYAVSTLPIVAPSSATMTGNLSINGNLSLTGSIAGSVSATSVVAGTSNGIINAVAFSSSSDIGAKINDSFSNCVSRGIGCHVFVPAGNYTQTVPIVVPYLANQQIALTLDDGCNITYTGSGVALSTTTNGWSFRLEGGQITGTSAGVAGVLLAGGTQDVYIERTKITGFTSGDGIIDLGTNVVHIIRAVVKNNMNGIDLEASSGYASNAVAISFSHVSNNSHWGIINGTVSIFATGGVASPNFNNSYTYNDLEGNGSGSSGSCTAYSAYTATNTCYGAILEGYSVSTVIQGNYFEGSYRPIVLGAPVGMAVLPILNAVSNSSNGGTPTGAYIVGNYLTSGSNVYDFVSINATGSSTINANSGSGAGTTCYVDIAGSVGLGGSTIGTDGNQAQAGSTVCDHGSAGITGNYDIQGYYQAILSAGGPIRLNSAAAGTQKIAEFYNGTSTVASVDGRGAITGMIFKTGVGTNTDAAGQVTLSSGTAAYAFTGSYTLAPICTASDVTAANPVKVSASAGTVTFTGTGSDVINYLCSERY